MNKVLNGIFQFVVILGVGFCGGYVLANLAKDKIVSLQEPNFLLLGFAYYNPRSWTFGLWTFNWI